VLFESKSIKETEDRWKTHVETADDQPGSLVLQIVAVRQHYALTARQTLSDCDAVQFSVLVRQLWRFWARAPPPAASDREDVATEKVVKNVNDVLGIVSAINQLLRPLEVARLQAAYASSDPSMWASINSRSCWPLHLQLSFETYQSGRVRHGHMEALKKVMPVEAAKAAPAFFPSPSAIASPGFNCNRCHKRLQPGDGPRHRAVSCPKKQGKHAREVKKEK
jgi:hypothetical protein